MRRAARALLLAAAACAAPPRAPAEPGPAIVVLGAAQDAGRPHLGCFRGCCEPLRAAGRREPVAALALIGAGGRWWLVDATPDLPAQVHAMGSLPAGIVLTHAHVGHYTGLMYLGREGMAARGMPVYCSEAMAGFLRSNAPWDQLVRLGNVELRTFRDGARVALGDGLEVEPIRVPHRDEYADTHGFGVHGLPGGPVLYVPDVDRWETWERDFAAMADSHPLWLVDGSFFSGDELGGRDMREIPHPTARHSMDLLEGRVRDGSLTVWFTHLNHTNPLWDPGSAASREAARRGFRVARAGEVVLPR